MSSEQNKSPPTFTPGPWRVKTDSNQYGYFCILSNDATTMAITICGLKDGEVHANAQLIAAAPDLLGALQNLMNGIDTGVVRLETYADEHLSNALGRIRSAIKRATGAP